LPDGEISSSGFDCIAAEISKDTVDHDFDPENGYSSYRYAAHEALRSSNSVRGAGCDSVGQAGNNRN
jgi:hypothetical protein